MSNNKIYHFNNFEHVFLANDKRSVLFNSKNISLFKKKKTPSKIVKKSKFCEI